MYAALSWAGLVMIAGLGVLWLVAAVLGKPAPKGYWSFSIKLLMILAGFVGLLALSLGAAPFWVIP